MKRALQAILITCQLLAPATVLADGPSLPGLFNTPLKEAEPEAPRFFDSRDSVEITAIPSSRIVTPGEDLIVAIIFDHDPGWHIHTDEPVVPPELGEADDYIDTEIFFDLTASSGVQVHEPFIQWP
ncbi:MAG: hypothetical protein P8L37_05555, partial [Phycisphaerales bacterium]|nr:hypothetical protein [Phycisphaerales bacterium]